MLGVHVMIVETHLGSNTVSSCEDGLIHQGWCLAYVIHSMVFAVEHLA
jgi:hypothetical protein